MIKRYRHEEIVKRMDNLKEKLGGYMVDAVIGIYKTWTDDEDDCLHLAFYHLKDNFLRYRQQTFGQKMILEYKPKPISIGEITWNTVTFNDYSNLYVRTSASSYYTTPIYVTARTTNAIW